jgi:hypothetical protein
MHVRVRVKMALTSAKFFDITVLVIILLLPAQPP